MTREEFEQFHKECKEGWEKLAKEPDTAKFHCFKQPLVNSCPACEIANRTWIATGVGKSLTNNCQYCPIDAFRKYGRHPAGCQRGFSPYKGLYGKWCTARLDGDLKTAAKAALAISKLKWRYLKVYEKV